MNQPLDSASVYLRRMVENVLAYETLLPRPSELGHVSNAVGSRKPYKITATAVSLHQFGI